MYTLCEAVSGYELSLIHILTWIFKEKECQAREAEEVRQLDIKLLHQRAIEAEEDKKREVTLPYVHKPEGIDNDTSK